MQLRLTDSVNLDHVRPIAANVLSPIPEDSTNWYGKARNYLAAIILCAAHEKILAVRTEERIESAALILSNEDVLKFIERLVEARGKEHFSFNFLQEKYKVDGNYHESTKEVRLVEIIDMDMKISDPREFNTLMNIIASAIKRDKTLSEKGSISRFGEFFDDVYGIFSRMLRGRKAIQK